MQAVNNSSVWSSWSGPSCRIQGKNVQWVRAIQVISTYVYIILLDFTREKEKKTDLFENTTWIEIAVFLQFRHILFTHYNLQWSITTFYHLLYVFSFGHLDASWNWRWVCTAVVSKTCFSNLRASAWETGADLEMMVGRFRLELVHNVVMWTYAICQSFTFNELFLAEFWISAPQGSPEADFQCNFGHFSTSVLATYN